MKKLKQKKKSKKINKQSVTVVLVEKKSARSLKHFLENKKSAKIPYKDKTINFVILLLAGFFDLCSIITDLSGARFN